MNGAPLNYAHKSCNRPANGREVSGGSIDLASLPWLGYWDAEDIQGVNDSSIVSWESRYGGPSLTQSTAVSQPSLLGEGLRLTGTDGNYVELPDPNDEYILTPNSLVSIEGEFSYNGVNGTLLGKYDFTVGALRSWWATQQGPSRIRIVVSSNGGYSFSNDVRLNYGWDEDTHTFEAVREDGQVAVYVDSVRRGISSLSEPTATLPSFSSGSSLLIGAVNTPDPRNLLRGYVNRLKVYKDGSTPSEGTLILDTGDFSKQDPNTTSLATKVGGQMELRQSSSSGARICPKKMVYFDGADDYLLGQLDLSQGVQFIAWGRDHNGDGRLIMVSGEEASQAAQGLAFIDPATGELSLGKTGPFAHGHFDLGLLAALPASVSSEDVVKIANKIVEEKSITLSA